MMLKKKVDGLEDYYYQWMNKYKDDADRRGELLKHTKKTMDSALRSLKAIGNSSYMPIMNRLEGMIEMVEKELADAKS